MDTISIFFLFYFITKSVLALPFPENHSQNLARFSPVTFFFLCLEKWPFFMRCLGGMGTQKTPSPGPLPLCILYCMWQGALKTPGRAVFTRLRHCAASRGLGPCTHCLVCAPFIGAGLPAIYMSSVTLWRNFPYVRCVILALSVCRKKWTGYFCAAAFFFSHTNSVVRLLHANNEQTPCRGRQRPKSNFIGI